MRKKLVNSFFISLFFIFPYKVIAGQISAEIIAQYEYAKYDILQEAKLIQSKNELDTFLINTGYDSTRSSITLTKQPDFSQVIVFAFWGWPCIVDSIVEQDTILIEYHLDGYNYPPTLSIPLYEVKIGTIPQTSKTIKFINNTPLSSRFKSFSKCKNIPETNYSQKRYDLIGKQLNVNKISSSIIITKANKFHRSMVKIED